MIPRWQGIGSRFLFVPVRLRTWADSLSLLPPFLPPSFRLFPPFFFVPAMSFSLTLLFYFLARKNRDDDSYTNPTFMYSYTRNKSIMQFSLCWCEWAV